MALNIELYKIYVVGDQPQYMAYRYQQDLGRHRVTTYFRIDQFA